MLEQGIRHVTIDQRGAIIATYYQVPVTERKKTQFITEVVERTEGQSLWFDREKSNIIVTSSQIKQARENDVQYRDEFIRRIVSSMDEILTIIVYPQPTLHSRTEMNPSSPIPFSRYGRQIPDAALQRAAQRMRN